MKHSSLLIFIWCLFVCYSPINSTIAKQTARLDKCTDDSTPFIAITIDDLPGVNLDNPARVTKKLLTTLKKFQIPAIGFVVESQLYTNGQLDKTRLDLLENWLKAGMELGNHTYSHPDYNALTFKKFAADLIKGEKHTQQLQAKYGQQMQYFRAPYLHLGNSQKKKDKLEQLLAQKGYINAPVTIDNSEWIFAKAYHIALQAKQTAQMKKIGNAYIQYMEDMTIHFEQQSIQLFGRPIKHILLIHSNALNADYLEQLLNRYQQRGYQFISLTEALTEEAYQTKDGYIGRRGISWLYRWALTQQVDHSFFEQEPTCPTFIEEITGIQD